MWLYVYLPSIPPSLPPSLPHRKPRLSYTLWRDNPPFLPPSLPPSLPRLELLSLTKRQSEHTCLAAGLDCLTLHLLLVGLVVPLESQVEQVPGLVDLALKTLDGVVDAVVGGEGERERGREGGVSLTVSWLDSW